MDVFTLWKFSLLLVPLGLNNPKNQRFQLLEMLLPDCEVHAEPVPGAAVPVMEMAFEAGTQILRQADVVELSLSIKCINPIPTPNILFDDLLMLL